MRQTDGIQEVFNESTGTLVATQARVADTMKTRMVGLLGRKGMDPGEALIFPKNWSIHTLFMRFKIDVIFLDKEGAVKKIVRRMPAYRFAWSPGARDTIEMTGGALDESDVVVGHKLIVRRRGGID
jgi:uncharacterized protein